MNIEVTSKVARKHYKCIGKIIKQCKTRWNEKCS